MNKVRGDYSGTESTNEVRDIMNPRIAIIDKEINRVMKYVISILIILSAATSYNNGDHEGYLIYFLRQFLILSSIMPICMRINLDLSKMYFSYMISNDSDMHGSKSHNYSVVEELGRIQYLVTDKTGTLTNKQMGLKKICTEFAIF
jgi:phospholipid-translocating ATPase